MEKEPNASGSSVHDGFNFAAVAFSPLVTKQTRPPRKKKHNRSMKQPQEQSQKPDVSEANRPEGGSGNLKAVGNPSTAKRRVTFKNELENVLVVKSLMQNPKRTFSNETQVYENDATRSTAIEGEVLKRNNDISRDSDLSATRDGKRHDDGEGARATRDTSTEAAIVGRAGISKPLLTERLLQGKRNRGQADDVTAECCQAGTRTHPESKWNSLRDEQRQVCTEKNADQLTITSEQLPHDRCALKHEVGHPTIRICKVTPGEETTDATHGSRTSLYTSVVKTTDERRQQREYCPECDDDRVLVIDETRCKASGDEGESVARRATAEDMVCLHGTAGTLSTTQHRTTLAGEVVLHAVLSQKDDVQDTNQTDTDCGLPSHPLCNPESRPNDTFETKRQEVKDKNDDNQTSSCDKGAVLSSSSAVCFTKPSLVLCGGRSSSYSSPRSIPNETSQGSGGSFQHVPASAPADTSSKQTRLMAARLQTGTANSSSFHSTLGTRCPPGQNTIQEKLISEQSVETRKLLAPSYFKSSRAPEQSLRQSSLINHVSQTSNHSSLSNTKTTSPSVQILANANLRGPHYMVLTRKVAIPQQGPHQAQFARPQCPSLQPQFVPPKATVFYRAPHTLTCRPAQYKQTAVQSDYPIRQGSFEISGQSSQQRFNESQPWHQRDLQAVTMKQPTVKTSSQLIRPAVFAAPAPSAYPNQTAPAMPNTQSHPPQWTRQTGGSSKIQTPFPQRAAPAYLQGIQPPPPPPQSQQLPHQVRIMKHPSGTTREQHVTPNCREARVTPSSLIPNGTLFVQTPQGLVQIQQHGDMNRPQTGSQQQMSATRTTTRESVDQSSSFERQTQSQQGSSVSNGQRPSTSAVATLTPASTVVMKSDKLTGVRLPYPMPTQRQLLFLSSKTETPNPPKTTNDAPPSNREVKVGIYSHATKHTGSTRPLPDGKTITYRSGGHAEGDCKKLTRTTTNETTINGFTNGSKEGTKHTQTLAGSETNEDEYPDKHKTSSRRRNHRDAASATKSRIETKTSQLDDSEQQHNKSVSGLPRSSYVKFLDSSVTVKCMYFPKAPSGVNEDREMVQEEFKDPSPSETLLDEKESDVTKSHGCKDGETSVNLSEKLSPLRNEPELEDETKEQDVRFTERQRRGVNNQSSVKYTEAESDDDNDDETWHPGPRKSPSTYTRRFRNPRTGGLSKINIQASATEGSGHPPEGTLRSPTIEENTTKGGLRTEPENKSDSKATYVKLNHGELDLKRDVEIVDDLEHPETGGVSKNTFESEIVDDESLPSSTSSSGSSFKVERKLEASPTKSSVSMTPKTPKKCLNSNSTKHARQAGKTVSDVTPGTPNVKKQTGSNASSPSKRPHQRSSQCRSSDSDNRSSKYPKKISSKMGFHKAADTATSPPIGQPRASPRRLHDGHTKQSPAPLWQRVLKMLGLKKKKPVRSPPPGATVWHKRRSSSVVLAESLAESARRLEQTADDKSELKKTFAETGGLFSKKKGTEKNRSLTKEKQRKEGAQSGSKKSSKKKKQTKTKKHHKRRKIVKTAKVSPESTTDPASGSLTSIDFDARRQTRSRTRRERDSDSISSSLADSASSASPSARRGRRTLASISAQTWEDCYRCTYLKWKETNESPETLTNDEGFKVMTNDLATPSRAGPSKDKKCFQKLLMSKWEGIVQTAQTGTVEEKLEPNVDDEGWPFDTTSFSFVETPLVASELSVCTTDCFRDASTFAQQDDWNVHREDTDSVVSSQVDIKQEELCDEDTTASLNALVGSDDKNVIGSYGYPPILRPIQDYSEIQGKQGIKYPSQDTPSFFIPQTLTEETLQLLAESGSIDPDLNGLQAFALFMPESGRTDQYGDPSSTSPPPQPVSSDGEEDVPPVISCHKLHTDDVTHEDRIVDVGEVEENTNQSNLFYIPVPLTKGPDSQEHVNNLLEPSDAPHPRSTVTEERGNSYHHRDAETGNNRDQGNEEEDESLERVILRRIESSLEEGEIIDELGFSDCRM